MYFDTIKTRYDYIMQLLTNDPNLTPSLEELTNCKSNFNIFEVMKNIKPKLKYVSSGGYGHTFHGYSIDENENPINYALKVVAYSKHKYGTINNVNRPENAELRMIKLLGQLVLEGQTPHLVLPITEFNTSIKHFININLKHEKRYNKFIDNYKKKHFHDDVSILISEWADRGDFLKYLRKNLSKLTVRMWKVLMFQLISCLATIQSKYPNFRHNDLKSNNVLVQKLNPTTNSKVFHYHIEDKHYFLPSIGIMLKIWDFDFAVIKGVVDNLKTEEPYFLERGNISSKKHQYYDLHFFLNTIGKPGFVDGFYETIPGEFRDFIHRIIPPHFRDSKDGYVAEKGRLLVDTEFMTPREIIERDPFFKEFRIDPPSTMESVTQAPTV